MPAILPLLLCLQPEVTLTTIRQLSRIVPALLAITGRVTMLGISRWTGQGASYRDVQRFFATVIPWAAPHSQSATVGWTRILCLEQQVAKR